MVSDKGIHVMTPGAGDAVSERRITQTNEDRIRHGKEFRENKQHQQKVKEERFAAIRDRQKNRPGGSGGAGINIEAGDGIEPTGEN